MFARVVFGQLILAELLELVGHCLLQACWQRVAEALETDKHCQNWTRLNRQLIRPDERRSHCAVDPDDLQPIRGQLHSGAEVSAQMRLGGGLAGS